MNTRKPNKPFQSHKEDILRLRKKGFSYNKIAKVLGCSKGTISYHCGRDDEARKKLNAQSNKKRSPLALKINAFKSRITRAHYYTTLRNKLKGFKAKQPKSRGSYRVNNMSTNFTIGDVIERIGEEPVCYLTGKKIDLNNTRGYSLDHIIPTILGGTNDLSNLGICCTEANHAKAGLSLEDFYTLIEEILKNKESTLKWVKEASKDGKS